MAFFLEREKTGSTPYVLIDEERKYMKIAGDSFHENVMGFFKEVNDWLHDFLETDFSVLVFDCQLVYFNSSTAKLLLNMILEMDEHISDNNKITVNWITTSDNDIIIECGEDFRDEVSNIEFNLVIN